MCDFGKFFRRAFGMPDPQDTSGMEAAMRENTALARQQSATALSAAQKATQQANAALESGGDSEEQRLAGEARMRRLRRATPPMLGDLGAAPASLKTLTGV